ncbi:MAG: MBL fold metallo-hydrolase [Actinomycetes bacterium]
MKITVIGRSPSWQDAGGACSGYLVTEGSDSVLLECGSGVFAKLREVRDHRSLDAVVISHLHADHFLDLIPFSYALTYGPPVEGPRPRLILPPGGLATLRTICGTFDNALLVEEAFDASEYDPSAGLAIGGLRFDFQLVSHFIEAWAIAVSGSSGGRFVFGADTGPCDALPAFAQAADLLMLEATFAADAPAGEGHLTPIQAGEIAQAAGAARLVLTHASDCLDLEASVAAAAAAFAGPVEMAREASSWDV